MRKSITVTVQIDMSHATVWWPREAARTNGHIC